MFQDLRIFRAYRLASQLGFEIDKKTLKACRTYFGTACNVVSGQRILIEIEKMSKVWKYYYKPTEGMKLY